MQRDINEDENELGYTLELELILRAWKRFRPVNAGQRTAELPRTKDKNIQKIFGKLFIHKLMSQIRLRLYDF